jgi:hypothetical protein
MKKLILLFFMVVSFAYANAQCTTSNAAGCRCKDSTQTDCDLLPDIGVGHPPFYDIGAQYGVIEFSQYGNGADNGRLKVTVSTPNTGFGPLELRTTNVFVCGTDTFIGTAPSICPDGITYPRIVINQRIYHKNASSMTYYDRFAGTMTYHPSHGHMHVDNWGNYTLRMMDSTQADPLLWPIIGQGTKLAFCVEDYTNCTSPQYANHCLDSTGAPLNNVSDFPNYGLGGGSYGCSSVYQGISSGYNDIYWTSLDGMWIDLPKGLCNGTYWIVCEVDPNHNFLEENENNNVYAAPFTLTKQLDSLSQVPLELQVNGMLDLCPGESVILTPEAGMLNNTYMWSNGATSKSLTVTQAGTYNVTVNSTCGSAVSQAVTVTTTTPPTPPTVTNDTIVNPGVATLTAMSALPVIWYDQPSGGSPLDTGYSFNTPSINASTTFYAQTTETHYGAASNGGLADSSIAGQGGYYNGDQSMNFDVLLPCVLHEVTVYSQIAQNVTVVVSLSGNTVAHATVAVVPGPNTVTLDFPLNPATGYTITRSDTALLFRNNPNAGNLGYPFAISNLLSITGSTAGDGYWYFFYDWSVRTPDHTCTSGRIPVQAIVLNPVSAATVDILSSLSVYPNPATNTLNISFNSSDKNCRIELMNELGQVAMTRNVTAGKGIVKETLNISELSRGVYNVHIVSNGKNYYQKVLLN